MYTKVDRVGNFRSNFQTNDKLYIPVQLKFIISHLFSFIWTAFSIKLSIPWLMDFSKVVTFPAALFVITGVAYLPCYFNAFLIFSLLFDRQPSFKNLYPEEPVTILIAARNEGKGIAETLRYISNQDYTGKIRVFLLDNGSTDDTVIKTMAAAKELNLDINIIREDIPGKFNALNTGLKLVSTELVITLDADTLLHKSAVRYLVARIKSSQDSVSAVAGSVLVRNGRENLLAKMQEWDYFLGIASIKRQQGLYQGTLVAQGAYSIYKTERLREIGGWPDAIGEDIVLTWNLLKKGYKTFYEPMAVAFTDVPVTLQAFAKQRSRWARGMIEALKQIKPWQQPQLYTKYLTGINFLMPYLDVSYTLFWLPGLVLAYFGIFWIVGPMTVYVIPLTIVSYFILYVYQRYVFRQLDLKVRKNTWGFIFFILIYQVIMSPVSVWGYIQEFLQLKRKWK